MKEQNSTHLQEEHVLSVIIDEKELAGEVRQHLLECLACRKRVEQFRSELQDLGQKARQAVPALTRPVELPAQRPVAVSHNIGWLSFFGAAAMASLAVFFYFMGLETMAPLQMDSLQSQEYLLEDESLMRDISEMVENPLSEDIYKITGESGAGFDDDFLEFIVPDILDDFQSELFNQGGIKRC